MYLYRTKASVNRRPNVVWQIINKNEEEGWDLKRTSGTHEIMELNLDWRLVECAQRAMS